MEPKEPEDPQNNEPSSLKDKFSQALKNEKFDAYYNSATSNIRDLVCYVVLLIGIVLLFFDHIWGGTLVGIVAGIYFAKDIAIFLKNYDEFIEQEGIVKSLILFGIILAFFISAPVIFIAAIVTLGIIQLLASSEQ